MIRLSMILGPHDLVDCAASALPDMTVTTLYFRSTYMKLPMLAQDKANHFVYGSVISAIGCLGSPVIGLVLVVIFGMGKEVYDTWKSQTNPGSATPDTWDAVITIVGGAVVAIPLLIKT